MRKILVVTAHPDDVDFGAAGTVAAWTDAGIEVVYCVATDGDAGGHDPSVSRADMVVRRRAEQIAAAKCVGVSDGVMLYAADIVHGGTKDRLYVSLDGAAPPEALWWLSVHGIYREVEALPQAPEAWPEGLPQKVSSEARRRRKLRTGGRAV